MMGKGTEELDFIAELRLRQWARRNHVPAVERCDSDWHSIVIDEMRRVDQDRELNDAMHSVVTSAGVVPLEPSRHTGIRIDEPYAGIPSPKILHTTSPGSETETFIPYYV
jgi:hypothetical protein